MVWVFVAPAPHTSAAWAEKNCWTVQDKKKPAEVDSARKRRSTVHKKADFRCKINNGDRGDALGGQQKGTKWG